MKSDFDHELAALGGVDTAGVDALTVHASLIRDLAIAAAVLAVFTGAAVGYIRATPEPVQIGDCVPVQGKRVQA